MSILFEPMVIKGMELKNRFVRSATYDGHADHTGQVTDGQMKFFEELSRGGAGLIITGISHVHDSGQTSPIQNSVASDDCIPGLKKLSAAVHNLGAKIAIQLFHAGRESLEVKLFSENDIPWEEIAFRVINATLLQYFDDRRTGRFPFYVGSIAKPTG